MKRLSRSKLSPFSALLRLFALLMLGALSTNALAAASCTPDPNNPPPIPQAWQNCYAAQAAIVSSGGKIIESCFLYKQTITPSNFFADIAFGYNDAYGGGPLGQEFDGWCIGTSFTPKNDGNPNCDSCTGDPINAGTGNLYRKEQDYADRWLPFARHYNSDSLVAVDTIGSHWRHTYSRKVAYSAPNTATLLHEDGKAITFILNNGSWSSDSDIHDTLSEQVDGSGNPTGWTYFRADTLDTEQYDASGHLISIVDANGFLTMLTYSTASTPTSIAPGPGYLITVTDPSGRSLQLAYGTLSGFASSTGFLKSMTDPSGNVYQYSYDSTNASANLVSVTYPGTSTSRTFLYAESSHVPSGAVLPNAMTGIVDENSARNATFDFDAIGNATSTQHGSGADKFTLAYNSDGSADVTDPQGGVSHHAFTTTNSMALASTLSGPSIGFSNAATRTYDSYNNQLSTTDFDGRSTCYTYDAAHGLETSRIEGATGSCSGSPSGVRSIQTDWNTTLRKPTERRIYNASGTLETKTDWVYNTRRQTTARCEVDPAISGASSYTCGSQTNAPTGVRQTTYTYCEQAGVTAGTCPIVGLVLSVDGPRTDVSDITTYTYYKTTDLSGCATLGGTCHTKGDLLQVTNALSQVTTYISYDKAGRVTRLSNANGTLTDMTYHARGWLLTRTVRANANGSASANDATTTFAYDNAGNVTQITQPDGSFLHYVYDDAHRLTDIYDSINPANYLQGNHIHYTLDAAGNRTQEDTKDPSGTLKRTLSRQYDQLNRLTKSLNAASTAVQTYQNPAEAPPTGITYTNGYDGNGNAIYSADALSAGTEQQYDPLNRLIKTLQDHAGTGATHDTTTQYAYDARDNLRSVSDPDGLITGYTYDGLNNLTNLSSPDTGGSGYTYDAAGNRKTQTDARGVISTYSYDVLNRLISISYPTTSLNVSYHYDEADSVTGCVGSASIGRLTTMIDASGSTTYCYDNRGNLTQVTQALDSQSITTAYLYNVADRLNFIIYPSGDIVGYDRDATGRITDVTFMAGDPVPLVSGVSYAPFGPVNTISFANGRTLTKSYDKDYAISGIASSDPNGFALTPTVDALGNLTQSITSATRNYAYDPLYRLTQVKDGSSALLEAYSYGSTGDRSSKTLGTTTQSYAYTSPLTSHRLQSIAGVARSYDANGNTTQVDTTTYTYDDRNRLTAAGGATYSYNGKGERVMKRANGTDTLFVYGPSGNLMSEYRSPFTCTNPNFFNCDPNFNGLSWPTEYLWLDNTLIGVVQNSNLYYVETDQLGSPRAVIAPGYPSNDPVNGDKVVWKWDYAASAFGENAPNQDPTNSGNAFVMNLRFPGQYFDTETGLHHNYYRDYEPSTGRYVESDPIGLRGGPNTYAYVDAKPLMLVDPYGQSACTTNCCANASWPQTEGGVVGGRVMCCNKQPVACVNPHVCDGLSNEACLIAQRCAARHEQYHIDNGHSDCSGQEDGPATPRDKNSNECDTYSAMERCFSLMFCNGSTRCQQEIRLLQKKNQDQKNFYCSRKGS